MGNSVKKAFGLQSAMEYLMTYGWAILVIAVVLGTLFQLGVFSSSSFAPRAPPGACQIFRPNGPWTATNINTVGSCSGQLPQYVATFTGSQYASVQDKPYFYFAGTSTQAISFWINIKTYDPSYPFPVHHDPYDGNSLRQGWNVYLNPSNHGAYLERWYDSNPDVVSTNALSLNTWYHVVITYDGVNAKAYLNGVLNGNTVCSRSLIGLTQSLYIGGYGSSSGQFSMSNVQLYNASISAPDVQGLYQEGIGGAPIQTSKLVGWWPLNGDLKDYSGNNNQGVPVGGITYTSQWLNGYR
jgi:hypothetical protein